MQANELDRIVTTALADFAQCDDPASLENAKARYLGKTGALTEQLKALSKLPAAERPAVGAAINDAKAKLEAALNARRASLADAKLGRALAAEALDVTLPGRGLGIGALHPLTRTLDRVYSGRSASKSPTARRSKTTSITSPRSIRRRIIRRARCRIRSTSKAAWCCARTRRRYRFATWKRMRRQSRSSRRAAYIASTATQRIRRCSIRSRDCG